ncbi:MAG: carbohydrate ABC transporter permease [Spirochaetaceae bacterium]|nr:MAG: carbohydrate ABC transporter permease [Spirochaetaceae bacterium]
MVIPFLWMISTSLKSLGEVFRFPPTMFGERLVWENYSAVSDRYPFGRFFVNSLYISAIVVSFQVITSALAGYSFARLRFTGRDTIFALYLATLIVPFHVTIVPTFWIMRVFGWIDTHISLILPSLVTAFGTFLMRQFFMTIPDDLENAAKIDGCTPFGIFWRVFLPLTKPALATLAVFVFIGIWNDFFRPLVFINSIRLMTIPLGLAAMQGMYSTNWPVLMAATMLSLTPVLIAFISAQEYFVRGVTLSGLKG